MKTIKTLAVVALTILLGLGATSCLNDREIDVVLNSVPIHDYFIDSDTENYADDAEVQLGQEIIDALDDAGYGLDDLDDAYLVSVDYGVFEFENEHDWTTSGAIDVSSTVAGKQSDRAVLINYTDVSIQEALDQRIPADLNEGGRAVINDALNAFLDSEGAVMPVLNFSISGGDIGPTSPTEEDPIQFGFRGWITIQVIVKGEVEVFELF